MGRFGLKKSDGDDESPNRLALFGSRSKNKSPAPPSNPYAKPIPTDPYTRAKINAGVAPLSQNDQSAGPAAMSGPPAGPPGPSGFPGDNKFQGGGYAPNKYGGQGGYGGDRFGGAGAAPPTSRYGPGGYGGLGGADPNDPGDAGRDALFGDARERAQQQPQGVPPPPYSEGQTAYGGGSSGYTDATYSQRNLTAEEEEEEEIQTVKQDIRFIKQGDVASTRNALRVAAQAEETGREALARLGAQGERMHDTEKNLDMATIEGRIAEEKAKELNTLNKSMFAVHVSNPFTSARRRRERDEKVLNNHREDRDTREGTRKDAFVANQRMERTFREIEREATKGAPKHRANVTERAKYQFEADSEDEAMETEIESNLNLLSGAAGRLNGLARATGRELDDQNQLLDRIGGKSDYVDDQIAMNRAKLDRIR
ncbi:Protein transport protein S9 plasma membrane t-SNARE [Aspergillus nanangensis]|uniref:Protein transport protein S9 plasma membrane t-SNARE n=1 Tax=Aspergillus nanangensis TaxID=2582783 RepID=A0AAD4GPF6_ASPNN|nr:Protein transport protein S9 plasma membrane t-SNARE [Aspergillus nanangensis]